MLLNPYRMQPYVGPVTGYRYFRMTVSKWMTFYNVYTANKEVIIGEFSIWTAANARHPSSILTSNTTPAPFVATASSQADTGQWPVWHCFERILTYNSNNRFISNLSPTPHWIQIDLGEGASVMPTYCKISPAPGEGVDRYGLIDFKVAGSNTGLFAGEQQTFLDVVDQTTGWAEDTERIYTFS